MYQALYRKWRPRTFDDVVGQQNITVTLANEVERGSISHAYLFTGSRGTGKTTCAKILAKAVNCLNPQKGNPCNVCESCRGIDSGAIMDVVELDAASNRGIDAMRDLISETNFTPVKVKTRVYIVDEVHMLTTEASNAFLKTLEEPPKHVIFILATTDPQKLLPTVRSRCQRFDFRRITPEDIAERLQFIAAQEGFSLDEDAAALIARIADGGLRDAVSLLDLCSTTDKNITLKTVGAVAGIADKEFLFVLTDCIKSGDTGKALELVNELHNSFSDMGILCSELINHLRSLMIIKSVKSADALIVCTKADYERLVKQAAQFTLDEILHSMFLLEQTSLNLSKGYNKRTELELAVIRLCSTAQNDGKDALLKRIALLEEVVSKGAVLPPVAAALKTEPAETKKALDVLIAVPVTIQPPAVAEENPETSLQTTDAGLNNGLKEGAKSEIPVDVEKPVEIDDSNNGFAADMPPENCVPQAGQVPFSFWPDTLARIFKKDPALWGFFTQSSAYVEEDILTICMASIELAEGLLKDGYHMSMLLEAVYSASGKEYKIILSKKEAQPKKSNNKDVNSLFDKIKKMNFNS